MKITNYPTPVADGLPRTEFFDGSILPTIAGPYECGTGSGHIFIRTFDGTNWLSPMDNKTVSTVRMLWRGIRPGTVRPDAYPKALREALRADDEMRETMHRNGLNDPNIGALAA